MKNTLEVGAERSSVAMCISSPPKSNKPFCSRLKVPNAGSLSRVTCLDTSTAICVSGVSPCVIRI
jgi:hypothetical protein